MSVSEERARKEMARVQAYAATFGTEEGKAVLYDLMRRGHALEVSPAADPHAVMYQEGRRSIVMEIIAVLEFGPEAAMNAITAASKESKYV
jgi:hypothetical protein